MSDQVEYVIRQTQRGFELAGPVLSAPSVFQTEAEAISLARHLIAAKSGGGHIIHANGFKDLYQGTRLLNHDGALQR